MLRRDRTWRRQGPAHRRAGAALRRLPPVRRRADRDQPAGADCRTAASWRSTASSYSTMRPCRARRMLAKGGAPETLTELEQRGRAIGLRFIELDGAVGVLANGAGLTMTTMDAVRHYGGRPANFLEIGGDAYTKATPALELVLSNPRVKSLVVNFCGAFARTDVMAEGVVKAMGDAEAQAAGLLLDPRHRRGRSDQAGARAARLRALRPDGRRDQGGGGGGTMIVRRNDHVLVQGITGKQGTFWTERMQRVRHPCRRRRQSRRRPVRCIAACRSSNRGRGDARRRRSTSSVMFVPPRRRARPRLRTRSRPA